MAIPIDITKDPRKILFSKNYRCHELKFKEKDRNSQTSPEIRGGKQKLNCAEQSTPRHVELVVNLRSTREIDHRIISRCAELFRTVVDPRLWQRKCGRSDETGAGIFLVAVHSFLLSRFDLLFRLETQKWGWRGFIEA